MASLGAWWEDQNGHPSQVMGALAAEPSRVVLHWRNQTTDARSLLRDVAGLITTLHELGVGQGDVVGVLVAPNSPAMLVTRYAANFLGAAVCYLRSTNPATTAATLSIQDQSEILRRASVTVLVTDPENEARADRLRPRASGRLPLVTFGAGGSGAGDVQPADAPPPGSLAPADPERLAMIGFTTGSTGRPKGIRLPVRVWGNALSGVLAMTPPRGRLLCTTPVEQTVGPMVDAFLIRGGAVYLHEGFDAPAVLRAIVANGITELFLATTFLYRLIDQLRSSPTELSSLRGVIYGGSAAAPARLAEAVRVLGPVLAQGYGTSECGAISMLAPHEHQDPELLATVGRPLPGVSIRICDPESGRDIPSGGHGEIWVRSRNLMTGYLDDPASASAVLREGWFRTGDLGYLDDRGYLRLVDRVGDVVKTHGVKVYPAVVEREILEFPEVLATAAFGVRDADGTEHLHAAIVPRPGSSADVELIRKRLLSRLSHAHVPEGLHALPELPLNPGGKPDRRMLRSMLAPTEPGQQRAT